MKIVNIDGVQCVVLEEGEKIYITTPNKVNQSKIEIKGESEKLDILGNSSIVNAIRGEGMLEKVCISPAILSSEEIIKKCDLWLDMFKQVHDAFKKLVLMDKYREKQVTMELSFPIFPKITDRDDKGRRIRLNLKQYSKTLNEGVTISIDEANEDVYSYLVASALDYYVSQNLKGQQIDMMDFNSILYSNKKHKRGTPVPMLARLGSLTESPKYREIVTKILINHNVGESSEQLIANLRNKISNQQISDRMDSDINNSSVQYKLILETLNPKKLQ